MLSGADGADPVLEGLRAAEGVMKVWITGAGGMMGSHLTEMMRAEGHEVLPTHYKPTIDASDLVALHSTEVNITDWCSVFDSLAAFRPDAIVHLAAQSYPTI